ncbi:MAG: flagellar biosynthesis regulator FlaF [Rhodobacteraceae bacterium]|nr:flagellar biosynthesis regulator FlaF [Paracoccaceae bacterium]
MNALNMAQTAYAASQTPIRTPRGTEYEAFARITHHLKTSDTKGRTGFTALAQAIHQNRQLWTMLAADVADEANGLPQDLRARIFYLAEFTNHHSHLVLNREAGIEPLIEINTAIMRGLRTRAAAA